MIEDKEKIFFNYKLQPGKKCRKTIRASGENRPLISIITSYYNAKKYIKQTANCVLNQSFPYWEWIIVNDGSTEKGTKKKLKKISELDDRIHIYETENSGLAKGRDLAISKTQDTQYIFPLDADDLICNTTLECLYMSMCENPTATWAYTNNVGFRNNEIY